MGLTVGRPGVEVTRILVSLDVTESTIQEALERQCGLLLSHHPFPWRERRRFDLADPDSAMLAQILTGGLNLFAVHTNLDAAPYGHATYLALQLGLIDPEPLKPLDKDKEPGVGLGRIGNLPSSERFSQLITRFKRIINVQSLLIAGSLDQHLERVAICPGAAGDLIDQAISAGAQLLIGAEFSHHQALHARAKRLALIGAGHFATEMPAIQILNQACQSLFGDQGIEIMSARHERDPLSYL